MQDRVAFVVASGLRLLIALAFLTFIFCTYCAINQWWWNHSPWDGLVASHNFMKVPYNALNHRQGKNLALIAAGTSFKVSSTIGALALSCTDLPTLSWPGSKSAVCRGRH